MTKILLAGLVEQDGPVSVARIGQKPVVGTHNADEPAPLPRPKLTFFVHTVKDFYGDNGGH